MRHAGDGDDLGHIGLSKPFNTDLFHAGIWAYTAYLVIFPAGLGLSVQASRYRNLTARFGRRQAGYESLLGTDHVRQQLGTRISDAKRRWQRFFIAAVILHRNPVIGLDLHHNWPKPICRKYQHRFSTRSGNDRK